MGEKRKSLSQKLLQVAAKSEQSTDQVLQTAELITNAFNEDPFASTSSIRNKVCKCLVKDFKMHPNQALSYYHAAKDIVLPFMASGEKIAQADAQLDHIAKHAAENLYRTLYDSKGEILETHHFDSKNAVAAINAIKVKTDVLAKTQKNVIEAQKNASEEHREKDLNLGQANREQLENFLKQKLLTNPELATQIIKKKEAEVSIADSKAFYKED